MWTERSWEWTSTMDTAMASFLLYGGLPFCNIPKIIDAGITQCQLSHLVHWKSGFLWHNVSQRTSYVLTRSLFITYTLFPENKVVWALIHQALPVTVFQTHLFTKEGITVLWQLARNMPVFSPQVWSRTSKLFLFSILSWRFFTHPEIWWQSYKTHGFS